MSCYSFPKGYWAGKVSRGEWVAGRVLLEEWLPSDQQWIQSPFRHQLHQCWPTVQAYKLILKFQTINNNLFMHFYHHSCLRGREKPLTTISIIPGRHHFTTNILWFHLLRFWGRREKEAVLNFIPWWVETGFFVVLASPMETKSTGSDCDCGLGVSLWRSRILNQKLEFFDHKVTHNAAKFTEVQRSFHLSPLFMG